MVFLQCKQMESFKKILVLNYSRRAFTKVDNTLLSILTIAGKDIAFYLVIRDEHDHHLLARFINISFVCRIYTITSSSSSYSSTG